jgi:hypothetical protein
MPATLTTASLAATITQATLKDALKAAMTAAGFSAPLYDNAPTSDHILIYEDVVQPGNAKEKVFVRIVISTALAVTTTIGDSYTAGNSIIGNPCTSFAYTFASGQQIDIVGVVNAGKYKFLALSQGPNATARLIIGYVVPASLQYWANKNNYLFVYMPSPSFGNLYGSSNIANNTTSLNTSFPYLANTNMWVGGRELVNKLILLNGNYSAVVGYFPDDFAVCSGLALAYGDTLVVSAAVEEYRLFNATAGGICIRTV